MRVWKIKLRKNEGRRIFSIFWFFWIFQHFWNHGKGRGKNLWNGCKRITYFGGKHDLGYIGCKTIECSAKSPSLSGHAVAYKQLDDGERKEDWRLRLLSIERPMLQFMFCSWWSERMSGLFTDHATISSFAVDNPSLANHLAMNVTVKGMCPNSGIGTHAFCCHTA